MPKHIEKRKLPYSQEQLFDLVADVEKYPEFLPWCLSSKIHKREENYFTADLVIGFKMVRERFGSKVVLDRPHEIRVEYIRGPMRHLTNIWKFIPEKDGGCTVDFYVDFEFKNFLLEKLIGVLFHEAIKRMVAAFEERAKKLYS